MALIGRPPCDEGVMLHGAAASPCAATVRRWTLLAAVLGSSLAFVDGTVVNVALPAVQRELQATASQAQWVIESYALFLASLLLLGGTLGDRFGRKRVFMLGVAVFSAASVACALAAAPGPLIAARALQGIGAALLVPGSLALISATFPHSERGAAIGTRSAFSGIAAAVGPVLGGVLIDRGGWPWAFLVNVPIGVVLLVVCAARVPESRAAAGAQRGFDVTGAALVTLGLAGAVFALIEAPVRGWRDAAVAGAALAGVLGLALFVVVERRSHAPMLAPQLFRVRDFAGANLITLLLYAALGGGLYYLPLNLIQVQGWSATEAGAALLPFIAIMFALSRWAGRLVDRLGARIPLVAGPLVAGCGFALFALPGIGGGYGRTFLPAVCVLGLGMAITVAPLTTTVMSSVGAERAGAASGVNNAVSRAAGLLAIALFGIVMAASFDEALQRHLGALRLTPALERAVEAQRDRLAALVVPANVDAGTASAIRLAVGEAFVTGFRRVMLACAVLSLLSAASAWLLIGRRPRRLAGREPYIRR
jgi:EmrB/QacA subfamily drug resistance transporter